MSNDFEQISLKPGFMKHNGGVLFRNISENEYEFKSTVTQNHLNAAGITHGGYLSALIDAGAGTAAHRSAENAPCVTISLDLKFIGASKIGDEITGNVKILKKTEKAILNRRFDDELIMINHDGIILNKDEHPRSGLKIDDLEKLKTVFKEKGTVTAGNSSGINDGAAALLLTSLDEAKKRSIKPLAKIVSSASVGVDPSLMGLGPIHAVKKAVKKADWNLDDIDLFEINEAFAAQSIAVIRELGIDQNKVNVNGGAISLGHPIGASGARILVTLLHEMNRQKKSKGCATLCIGGGMGIALCIEKV